MITKCFFAAIIYFSSMVILTRAELATSTIDPSYDLRQRALADQQRHNAVVQFMFDTQPLPVKWSSGCSGTLIHSRIIVTAAHCIQDNDGFLIVGKGDQLSLLNGKPGFYRGVLGDNLSTARFITIIDYRLHPAWKGKGQNDIAVLKVADEKTGKPIKEYVRNGVPEPIIFHKLYSGTKELDQPLPNLAITVGYGNFGNGSFGEIPVSSGTKRAGLTVLSGGDTLVLEAEYLSPSIFLFNPYFLPSNFLQAGTAHGDSGGPLYLSIGTGGTQVIVGVAKGVSPISQAINLSNLWKAFLGKPFGRKDENVYGVFDKWTRISPYVTWIQTAAQSMGVTLQNPDPGT